MMPGGSFRLTGRNDDDLVKRGGRWLILRRTYHVMIEEAPGVGEVVGEVVGEAVGEVVS